MIEIVLGNIGSGKTAHIVREIVLNVDKKQYYSNIYTPKISWNTSITKDMIITYDDKKKPHLNVEFWKQQTQIHSSLNVVIDEAHTVFNARRGMSTQNIIMSDFIALLRRVIGSTTENQGRLILITQLERRLDVIAREMATKVKFCRCHYIKECRKCGTYWTEYNDYPKKANTCPQCSHYELLQRAFIIEVFEFANMEKFHSFIEFGSKSFYSHYYIDDIEKYFTYYNTLQWDNLIS